MSVEVWTKEEAARRARISERYLSKLIAEQEGPEVLRIGRRVLVRSDAFKAWIERMSRRQQPQGARAQS